MANILFEARTPLEFVVRVTVARWDLISTVKHPVMRNREQDVREALEHPHQIRRSKNDPSVLLFYRQIGPKRWTCAVAKRLNGDGFLITAFPTDTIKEGEPVWTK